jgi:hypothetical protein
MTARISDSYTWLRSGNTLTSADYCTSSCKAVESQIYAGSRSVRRGSYDGQKWNARTKSVCLSATISTRHVSKLVEYPCLDKKHPHAPKSRCILVTLYPQEMVPSNSIPDRPHYFQNFSILDRNRDSGSPSFTRNSIISRSMCDYRRGLDWWIDLLTNYRS